MGKLDAAADGLVAMAQTFQPLQDVADALKGLGSLEQAIIERKIALDGAVAQHEDMKAKVVTANGDLKRIQGQIDDEIKAAEMRIKATNDEAVAQATSIVDSATQLSEAMVVEAKDQVKTLKDASDAGLAEARDILAKLQTAAAEATATRDQAIQQTADMAVQMDVMRQTAQTFAVTPTPQPVFASTPNQSAAQTAAAQQHAAAQTVQQQPANQQQTGQSGP